MGYCSDIEFIIRGKSDDVKVFMAKMRLTLPEPTGSPCWQYIHTSFRRNGDAFIHFDARRWKWGQGYIEVEFIESFWKAAESFYQGDDTRGLEGSFIRIGEDDSDTESRRFGEDPYDLLYVTRVIETGVDITNEVEP